PPPRRLANRLASSYSRGWCRNLRPPRPRPLIRQLLVDRFERAAFGFEAEKKVHGACEREPCGQINESRRNRVDRDLGADQVDRTNDHREPGRPNALANPPEPIRRSHAGRAEVGWPTLGSIRSNHRPATAADGLDQNQ